MIDYYFTTIQTKFDFLHTVCTELVFSIVVMLPNIADLLVEHRMIYTISVSSLYIKFYSKVVKQLKKLKQIDKRKIYK